MGNQYYCGSKQKKEGCSWKRHQLKKAEYKKAGIVITEEDYRDNYRDNYEDLFWTKDDKEAADRYEANM